MSGSEVGHGDVTAYVTTDLENLITKSQDELINMIINLRIVNQQFLVQIHSTELRAIRSENERDVILSELKTNRDLAATVVKLTNENKTLKDDLKLLQDKFDAMEKRDLPITIREAMVLLETEISKDMFISGTVSKSMIKKNFLYSAKNIVQSTIPEVITARNDYLKRHNLSDDHLFCIAPLKDKGNTECHHNRPVLTRCEWNDLMTNVGDDEDLQTRMQILNLLEHYRPVSSDGKWNLSASKL
jgi:hypothetical protein